MEKTNRPTAYLLGLGIGLLASANLSAQGTFTYLYDNAGNRIRRDIPLKVSQSAAIPELVLTDVEIDKPSPENDDRGDKELDEQTFRAKAYPNPSDGLVTVELPDLKDNDRAQLRVFTMAGRLILQHANVQAVQTINFSSQPAGYYVLQITIGNKRVSKTLIKR